MAVFRKVKKTDFTVIDNSIFKNKKLSLKGKGMICTMLSLPEDWQFSEDGLTGLSNDGKASIRSTLKELMELGYLKRERARDEKGILRDYIYTIFEVPTFDNQKQDSKPNCDYPTLEKSTLENRNTYKELINKELNNKNTTIIDMLQENGFELTPIQYDVVKEWEDNDLTRYAIEQAVLNNKFNIKYIDRIIYSLKKENIKTVQQAKEREEQFRNKSKKLPTWFNQEQEINIEEKDKEELEELLKELGG